MRERKGSARSTPAGKRRMKGRRLREADLLRKALESLTDAVLILDAKIPPRIIDCNEASSKIFGYRKAEMLGRTIAFLHVSKEALREFQSQLYSAAEQNRLPLHLPEYRMRRKDRSVFPSEHIVSELVDEKGKRIGWVSVVSDITERKRIEESLKRSEERFRRIFHSLPIPTLITSLEGPILDVNESWTRLSGYSREEAIGRSTIELGMVPDPEERKRIVKALLEKRRLIDIEMIRRTRSGELRHILNTLELVELDGETRILNMQVDVSERKRLENVLRDSEENLRSFIDSIPNSAYLIDARGTILLANERTAKRLGKPLDQLIGSCIYDLIPSHLIEHRRSLAKEVFRTGRPVRLEDTDGETHLERHLFPVLDGEGKVARVAILGVDITERKRMEEAIRQSEERLRAYIEQATDLIFTLDSGGKVTSVNRAMCEQTGYTAEEFLGKSPLEFVTPEYRESIRKALRKILGGESVEQVEAEILSKDGRRIMLEVRGRLLYEEGRLAGTFHIARDVTERKRIEEILRESEARYRSLFENSRDAIAITTPDGKFVDANQAWLDLFGYSRDEMLMANARDVYADPAERETFRKMIEEKGYVKGYEAKRRKKDGAVMDCVVTSAARRADDGRTLSYQTIIRDITDSRRMEEELRRHAEHLEDLVEERTRKLREAERLAAIGETAAMVGHDLRNPLTGISGAAYVLRRMLGREMDEQSKEMLELVERDVEYSNKIINDLLDYSGEMHLEVSMTDPGALAKAALSLVRIPENIRVVDLSESKPQMTIDVDKMKRVYVNLIRNGIDAMPNGGTLTISSKVSDGNVEIAFTDTGVGMAEETMKKIWMPLFTTKARGMGFGLSISRRIVEAHGGSVSVESAAGKGSTFIVRLPIKPEPKEENKR